MPALSPTVSSLPTIESVMNLARVRVNDMTNSQAGDLLTDDAPYAEPILNAAWRSLQDELYAVGGELPIAEAVIYGLPTRASNDAANQCSLTWGGCFDGLSYYAAPSLPAQLVNPLTVWRRQSGTQNAFGQMTQAADGLPVWLDSNQYEWRANGMWFYGDTYPQDLRIRYVSYYQDLSLSNPLAQVPLMMSQDYLSARIAFEFASKNGGDGADKMLSLADRAFEKIAQRTSKRKQRQTIRRKPYSGGSYRPWPVIH